MFRRAPVYLAVAALALISPAPIQAWQWSDARLERVPLPSILHTLKTEAAADLDADGLPETLTLTQGRALLQTEGRTRWQSPPAWQVEQAQITDLDHDGIPEVTLLVWRPFKPWPVDTWLPGGGRIATFHAANGLSCHIILIGWKQGSFRELWA